MHGPEVLSAIVEAIIVDGITNSIHVTGIDGRHSTAEGDSLAHMADVSAASVSPHFVD